MISFSSVEARRVLDAKEHRHPFLLHVAEAVRHMADSRSLIVFKRPSVVLPKLSRPLVSAIRALEALRPSIFCGHHNLPLPAKQTLRSIDLTASDNPMFCTALTTTEGSTDG